MNQNLLMVLLSSLALFSPAAIAETSPNPPRILCAGYSITQEKVKARDEFTYRLPLQQMLHEAGIAYQFIDSQSTGLDGGTAWPDVAEGVPFDRHCSGWDEPVGLWGRRNGQLDRKQHIPCGWNRNGKHQLWHQHRRRGLVAGDDCTRKLVSSLRHRKHAARNRDGTDRHK